MKEAPPSAFAVNFDEYDLTDPESVARLRAKASEALDNIDQMLVESEVNFKQGASVAQQFVMDAQRRMAALEAGYRKHVAGLNGARHAADAVLQFSRRCSTCLEKGSA